MIFEPRADICNAPAVGEVCAILLVKCFCLVVGVFGFHRRHQLLLCVQRTPEQGNEQGVLLCVKLTPYSPSARADVVRGRVCG